MPKTVSARLATEADVQPAAAVLAGAFADYPWTRWVVDQHDHAKRLEALYALYLRVALRFGEVWMTDDGTAVAAWIWSENHAQQAAYLEQTGLDAVAGELAGDRAAAAADAESMLEPHRPSEPHWHLAAVGVAPAAQGRGLGTGVLRPRLAACDAAGELAALETSSGRNVALYERLGFQTQAAVDVPRGPRVWVMRRRPLTA